MYPVLMKIHILVQATGTKRTEENNVSHTHRPVKHTTRTPTQGKRRQICIPLTNTQTCNAHNNMFVPC
jgi:hypothetical protein